MKKIAIFSFLITFLACNSQKNTIKSINDSILTATYESWVAGIKGGGSGINFNITLKNKLPENTQLLRVIFKGYEVKCTAISDLNYQASIRTEGNQKEFEPTTSSPKSNIKLADNEAVLIYLVDGKEVQNKINNVKRLETIHFPNVKPKN